MLYRAAIGLICSLLAPITSAPPGPASSRSHKFALHTVVAASLLLVGGCAGSFGLPSPEASKVIAGAKTVGVVSAIGHKFTLQKVGVTVFGNELNEVRIDSWGVDNAAAGKVSALLGSRYSVKRISFAPQDLDENVESTVRKIAATQRCDLYLVITRASVPFGGTNQLVSGLGIVEGGGAINPDNVHLFAVTAVHVYDGQTFARLSWQRTDFLIGSSLTGRIINGPYRTLDRSWWPATPQAVHSDKLKSATRTLVEQSLVKTIPEVMGAKPAAN